MKGEGRLGSMHESTERGRGRDRERFDSVDELRTRGGVK